VTIQALAGVLGGTQSLHTDSYDEALALPGDHAVTVALRTQQILAEESGVANTVDPLGGSYFVEALTDRMERDAQAYIDRIEEMGGVVSAIENGFQQREIAEAAYRYQSQIDRKSKTVVGVNRYTMQETDRPETLKIDEQTAREQLAGLERVKWERDGESVERCLEALSEGARGDANLIPLMLDAVRAHATVGEVCAALVPVFGTYSEVSVI
jgi:methylmalonyl-CoA mutase N-terminal domain/subunit